MSDFRDQYAKNIIMEEHRRLIEPNHGPYSDGIPDPTPPTRAPGDVIKVGIIGAGAAGLYAGLIIDSLEAPTRITYDIFDADPMENRRGGGRLYTYEFPGGGTNDYFDIGAMRYPDIPFMKRVFDLIRDNLNSPIAGMLNITPYVLSNRSNLNFFNGIIKTDAELDTDPPPLDPFDTGVNPPNTVSNMVEEAIGHFIEAFRQSFDDGFKYLMEFDRHSTRTYMAFVRPQYSDKLINYMETFDSASGLFDQSLAETVLDSLTFDYQDNVSWYCVQGGTGKIADAMAERLGQTIEYGKRVTAIGIIPGDTSSATSVSVTVAGATSQRNYSHVISTMPLSCLRMVDTTECNFSWDFQTAIRTLHYDSSVKIGIRFSARWWESSDLPKGPHHGGASYADRPTRTVVYPSYGINDPESGASILVSYTWAQDAQRLGAWAQGKESDAEDIMLKAIVKDLADMHQLDYTTLWNMKLDHKVYDWYASDYSAGAFALFGPGQFSSLYPHVTKPVGGVLHFAGEATSVHHAWVVGAFISAYRTVYEILVEEGMNDLIEKMKSIWDMPGEVDDQLLKRQVTLGQDMKFPASK